MVITGSAVGIGTGVVTDSATVLSVSSVCEQANNPNASSKLAVRTTIFFQAKIRFIVAIIIDLGP
jgi:hypothetical protein